MNRQRQLTKEIALGGLLLALSLVTLLLASFVPGIELTLYAMSSLYVAILIINTSPKTGFIFYAASLLLSLLLLPNKLILIPYGFFFGLYGIAKFYIEKLRKQWLEIAFKLLFFNLSWGTAYLIFGNLFLGTISLPDLAYGFIYFGAQVFFLLYDAIYTLMVAYLQKRFPSA